MERRRIITGGLAAAATAMLPGPATHAQRPPYPTKPIKLVVPFPPGGPTDVFGRRFADKAREILGQPIVVDNRAGAAGTIGSTVVAKAAPDGYTMLFGTSSTHVTGPLMLANPPYDPLKDFTSLIVGVVPMVVAVRPTLPVQTVQDLVKVIRESPGKYTFGSAGPGSINHLGVELLKLRAGGLDALHVPYKGNNPAQMALVAGEVDFMLDTFGTGLPQHQSGKMRIIATCGERRSSVAPDIPTTIESGLADSTVTTVNMLALPAALPASVMDVVAGATRKAMADGTLIAALSKLGIEPVTDADPVRSARFFAAEIARWAPIIKATGVSI